MHIGLIGGIGPAATEFYYRGLLSRRVASDPPLNLTIEHADLGELVKNATAGDAGQQAQVFIKHILRLAAAGAGVAAITSLTGHFCIKELEAQSPLPLLNAIREIDTILKKRGLKRVGILGTRLVMESKLYGGISAVEVVPPPVSDVAEVHETYLRMAVTGKVTQEQRERLFSIGRRLVESQRADAVLLAGTDLFLAFDGVDPGFEWIDCAELHIAALHRTSGR
ncbi:MAG: aspartate/glutamate racemase family protein [Steroidobacteraceae bacterium]